MGKEVWKQSSSASEIKIDFQTANLVKISSLDTEVPSFLIYLMPKMLVFDPIIENDIKGIW